MNNTKNYRADDVCEALGISIFTLTNWYRWQRKDIKAGEISEPYLPEPTRDSTQKGKPRVWTENDVKELANFKKHIVAGRNGIYGKYTNPCYKNTKKYKQLQEQEAVKNE